MESSFTTFARTRTASILIISSRLLAVNISNNIRKLSDACVALWLPNEERRRWVIPCDTITKMLVDAGKMDPEVVFKALVAQGYTPVMSDDRRRVSWPGHTYDADTGKVRMSSNEDEAKVISALKMGYSTQAVKDQAARFGWRLQQTGPNKYKITKR